jgi:hypothetical protein
MGSPPTRKVRSTTLVFAYPPTGGRRADCHAMENLKMAGVSTILLQERD